MWALFSKSYSNNCVSRNKIENLINTYLYIVMQMSSLTPWELYTELKNWLNKPSPRAVKQLRFSYDGTKDIVIVEGDSEDVRWRAEVDYIQNIANENNCCVEFVKNTKTADQIKLLCKLFETCQIPTKCGL